MEHRRGWGRRTNMPPQLCHSSTLPPPHPIELSWTFPSVSLCGAREPTSPEHPAPPADTPTVTGYPQCCQLTNSLTAKYSLRSPWHSHVGASCSVLDHPSERGTGRGVRIRGARRACLAVNRSESESPVLSGHILGHLEGGSAISEVLGSNGQ